MAKKKIKKALKMAVPLIGAALAGKALMNRRRQNKMYLAEEGGNKSNILGPLQDNSFIDNDGYISPNSFEIGAAKKGGSAGRKKRSTITGVAVRGFGRALKGKK
jgi:hypothetical protein